MSTTPDVIVIEDNIEKCKSNMAQLKTNATESEREFFRVEGSLRVFASLKELGIDKIHVPPKKEVIEEDEVIDNVQGGSGEGEKTD